jgi:heme-degrading monooxygenase HmoA
MYARVATSSEGTPETIEKTVRMMAEREAGRKAAPGYKGAYLLTNRATGKSIAVMLWASEADLKAHTAVAEQGHEVARSSGVVPTPWEEYEVVFHVLSHAGPGGLKPLTW